jgi:hypothetical protein
VVRANNRESLGTAFAIADGRLLVTNNHVVSGEGDGLATLTAETSDGRKLKAMLIRSFPHRDLALLSVTEPVKPLFLATAPGRGAQLHGRKADRMAQAYKGTRAHTPEGARGEEEAAAATEEMTATSIGRP